MRSLPALSVLSTLLTLFFLSTAQADSAQIPYPDDYKQAFSNYLSLDRTMNPDQTIRLFANDLALQGTNEQGDFPYGSILVAEIYSAKKDAEGKVLTSTLGRRVRDKLALIAVMQRGEGFDDNVAAGLKNDDWGFAAFKPDGSPADKDLNACRGCHAPLVDSGHVFSFDHL